MGRLGELHLPEPDLVGQGPVVVIEEVSRKLPSGGEATKGVIGSMDAIVTKPDEVDPVLAPQEVKQQIMAMDDPAVLAETSRRVALIERYLRY